MVVAFAFIWRGVVHYWWFFIGDYYANLYTADFR